MLALRLLHRLRSLPRHGRLGHLRSAHWGLTPRLLRRCRIARRLGPLRHTLKQSCLRLKLALGGVKLHLGLLDLLGVGLQLLQVHLSLLKPAGNST